MFAPLLTFTCDKPCVVTYTYTETCTGYDGERIDIQAISHVLYYIKTNLGRLSTCKEADP